MCPAGCNPQNWPLHGERYLPATGKAKERCVLTASTDDGVVGTSEFVCTCVALILGIYALIPNMDGKYGLHIFGKGGHLGGPSNFKELFEG